MKYIKTYIMACYEKGPVDDMLIKETENLNLNVKSDIKSLFMSMTITQRRGFNLPLPKVMAWVGAFDDDPTDKEKDKIIENTILRDYIKNPEYNFKEDWNYKIVKDPSNPRKNLCLMTDVGFKIFCMVSHYPRSYEVRQYYTLLEREYIQALQNKRPDNKKMLDTLMRNAEDFKKYQKDMWYWSGEVILNQNRLNALNKQVQRLEQEEAAVDISNMLAKAKLAQLDQQYRDYKEVLKKEGHPRMELAALKKKFFRPIYISYVEPSIVNTLSEQRLKKKKKPDEPKMKYKMEKYMSREKVIEMGLQTESEDERDQREAQSGKTWEKGITFNTNKKPAKTDVAYYTISTTEPEKYVKKLWIPKVHKIAIQKPLVLFPPVPKKKSPDERKSEKEAKSKKETEKELEKKKDKNPAKSLSKDIKSEIIEESVEEKKSLGKEKIITPNHFDKLKDFLNSNKEYHTPMENVWKTSISVMESFLKNVLFADFSNPLFKQQVEFEYNKHMNSY